MARPIKEINWEIVEKLVEAGCTAKEISYKLNIDVSTFYDRYLDKFSVNFHDSKHLHRRTGYVDIKCFFDDINE